MTFSNGRENDQNATDTLVAANHIKTIKMGAVDDET